MKIKINKAYFFIFSLILFLSCELQNIDTTVEINDYVPDFNSPENTVSYIVYGQSNSVSPAVDEFEIPTSMYSDHIWINDYYGEYSEPVYRGMEMIKPAVNKSIKSGATWMYLADMLYGVSGKDTVFYSCGVGGRSSATLASEPYLQILLTVIQKHPEAEYILYVQGESDAMSGLTENETYDNLKYMIETSEIVNSDIQWIVAIDGLGNPATRSAQQRIIDDGYALQGPDIDAIRLSDYSDVDLYGNTLEKHAQAWYNVLKSMKILG